MVSKEWRRSTCFGCLKFLGIDSSVESLETWKDRVSIHIHDITKQIKFDLSNYSDVDLPRARIIAQLSILSILISKEFEAALEAIVTGEWNSFDLLFQHEEKKIITKTWDWHDFRTHEVFLWCRILSRWMQQVNEGASKPVREIEPWEKRLWCEEIAHFSPRTTAPFEQNENRYNNKQSWRRYQEAYRLHLSIDPLSPVEIVTEMVANILREYQNKLSKEQSVNFQKNTEQEDNITGNKTNEEKDDFFDDIKLEEFDIDPKIIELLDQEDRLHYDDIRLKNGKIYRKLKDKANEYINWLTIYHLKRQKIKTVEIARYTNVPKDWETHLKENKIDAIRREHNKEKKRAQKLIEAALQGKSPLTVSVVVQPRPIHSKQLDR